MGRRFRNKILTENAKAIEMAIRRSSIISSDRPSENTIAPPSFSGNLINLTVRSTSSGELYNLKAERTANGVRFTCTCQAGQTGLHCKHRVGILLSEPSACVDVDETSLRAFHEMAQGSPMVAAVEAALEADAAVETAKREQKRARKLLAQAMAG